MKKLLLVMLSLLLVFAAGCGQGQQAANPDGKKLKVGATAVPHAEILEVVKPDLKEKGIDLEIVEFSDYVQPNLALNDKELDANFFQHEPYLLDFLNEHKEVKLKNAAGIHIEPMGVYSKKIKNLGELPEGADIAIPNDPTNGGRALLLLAKADLIALRDGANENAVLGDITGNPKNFKFTEVEAAGLPRTLEDVDAAVINTNYAMPAGLDPLKDALFIEDSSSPYVNIVAVREGDENRPEIKTLIEVMKSQKVKDFILEKYKGAVVPAF